MPGRTVTPAARIWRPHELRAIVDAEGPNRERHTRRSLERIEVPVELWHGEDDGVVAPDQARLLAGALPIVNEHYLPGEGHFSLVARHARAILESVAQGAAEL